MNKIDYEDAGLEFVAGDRFSGGVGIPCAVDYFAWRTNTGVKPEFVEGGNVIEWVSLGVDEVITSIKGHFNWNGSVVKWRPHLPSIQTETPEEKAALDKIAHVSNESKPIYTQAMCDAGELPMVGSNFDVYGDEECDDGLCHLRCVGNHIDGGVIGVDESGYMHRIISGFKPIKTEKEKRIAAASKNMRDYYFDGAAGIKFDGIQFDGYAESLDNAGLLK